MKSPAHPGRGGEADGIKQGELFDPPPFSPIFPKRSTLEGRALDMFLADLELEHPDFEKATGSWRLGAYVEKLRKKGWPIDTLDVYRPAPDRPDRVIARYRLPGWVLREMGAAHG